VPPYWPLQTESSELIEELMSEQDTEVPMDFSRTASVSGRRRRAKIEFTDPRHSGSADAVPVPFSELQAARSRPSTRYFLWVCELVVTLRVFCSTCARPCAR
jgi:hypothetical protein